MIRKNEGALGRRDSIKDCPMPQKFEFIIDVVGSCNLRCPSCPWGNSSPAKNAHGFIHILAIYGVPELDTIAARHLAHRYAEAGFCLFRSREPGLLKTGIKRCIILCAGHARRIPWLRRLNRRFPGVWRGLSRLSGIRSQIQE